MSNQAWSPTWMLLYLVVLVLMYFAAVYGGLVCVPYMFMLLANRTVKRVFGRRQHDVPSASSMNPISRTNSSGPANSEDSRRIDVVPVSILSNELSNSNQAPLLDLISKDMDSERRRSVSLVITDGSTTDVISSVSNISVTNSVTSSSGVSTYGPNSAANTSIFPSISTVAALAINEEMSADGVRDVCCVEFRWKD